MIKARIADFPGMRPGNHNVDAVVITDFRGNTRQILLGERVDLEVSFETRKQKKLLIFLDNHYDEFLVSRGVTARDFGWFLAGVVVVFLTLTLPALFQF